jgi:hypothetical protein
MAGKTRTTMRSDILTDLSGVADAEWTDTELNRAIEKAVADLQRFLPRQRVWETTLDYDEVTDEQVTLTAHGTYHDLDYKPVKWDSERICDDAAETTKYTRDTDYTIDYTNGKITSISGGSISATATIYCNYEVSRLVVDISGITDLIRVERVEYPVGNIPMNFVPVSVWGDYLIIEATKVDASQESMSDKKHVVVYYNAEHTAPTDSAAGTFPPFLDNTVILAASAYALFHKAVEREHECIDIANLLVPALASVKTYLDNNTDDDAESILANITDDAAALRTAISTALDAANTYLDETDTTDFQGAEAVWTDEVKHILTAAGIPNAEDFLETGDDYIPTVNVAKDVPERYAAYAQVALELAKHWRQKRQDWVDLGRARTNAALGFIQEAQMRLANIRTYTEESSGWIDIARGFLDQASGYANLIIAYMSLAQQYRQEAIERRTEAWAIWSDPKQYIGDFTFTALQQPGSYNG